MNAMDLNVEHKKVTEAIVKIAIRNRDFDFDGDRETRDYQISARFVFRSHKNRTELLGYFDVNYISKHIEGFSLSPIMNEAMVAIAELLPEYDFKGVELMEVESSENSPVEFM